jgi:putative transposase
MGYPWASASGLLPHNPKQGGYTMDEQIREKIALKRYQIISPVLAEPARAQNAYFREQANIEHDFPHYGVKKFGVSTMKAWLRTYRDKGFGGLKPNARSDKGRPRRFDEHLIDAISVKCKAYPYWSIQNLYEHLLAQDLLGDPPVHYNTLRRVVKDNGLLSTKARADVRKAYEMEAVNDLWVCDFMHGPRVQDGKRSVKAILCAIIDDHSRMVVGHAFNASETISSLTIVLKEAFMSYGIPKRLYVDNGPSFSSDLLVRACAMAGISLTHSKPYDSPSRGKIERFFRTVRDRFLSGVQNGISIEEINEAFWWWLKDDYHHKLHTGIKERPIDRYHVSLEKASIRRLSKAELDEIFLMRHERVVNNDSTISFKGAIYEVPTAYIRQKIEIRHPIDDPEELYLYDNNIRVGNIKLVDKKENARTFRPQNIPSHLSFHKGRVSS